MSARRVDPGLTEILAVNVATQDVKPTLEVDPRVWTRGSEAVGGVSLPRAPRRPGEGCESRHTGDNGQRFRRTSTCLPAAAPPWPGSALLPRQLLLKPGFDLTFPRIFIKDDSACRK